MTPAPSSLLTRLETAAESSGAITFLCSAATSGTAERVSWRELHDDARAIAASLQARGVGPGAHVAILGPTTRPLVTAIEATWLCGAATVMLPLPMRLASIEEFVRQTRARIVASDSVLVVVDDQLAEFLDVRTDDPPVVLLRDLVDELRDGVRRPYDRPADDPDALAILQYTSGSTSDPKGVMLPHRCVAANLDAIVATAGLERERDVGVSWLPLYHDMGLIGLLAAPMTTGMDLALAPPQDFLAAPGRWMEWMSEFRGTATAGPNFAYALATRALRRLDRLDLSSWRIAINGAEPIDPHAVQAFADAGVPHGLSGRTMLAAFGMAEATLAVTFAAPGEGLQVDVVDGRVLETDRYAASTDATNPAARALARLGRPLPNLKVRVCDPATGVRMQDREVGEVEIRGASVTTGYYGRPDATADAFHEGWLRTGDLGYITDGELVVCGRIKDMIILGGRNVYPQDVERAVAEVSGVRAGNVIAFGAHNRKGRESIVVVAETRDKTDTDVSDEIAARVRDTVGVPPAEVVLVRSGTLPKTSSGKLQRTLCRERYLTEALDLR